MQNNFQDFADDSGAGHNNIETNSRPTTLHFKIELPRSVVSNDYLCRAAKPKELAWQRTAQTG